MRRLTLVMGAVLFWSAAQPAIAVPVQGSVQFWERTCRRATCSAFAALGERQMVDCELPAPAGPGSLGRAFVTLTQGDLNLQLTFLSASPPDGSTPYLVAQALLSQAPIGSLAECTQYHSAVAERFFPVGACAAFGPLGADGSQREVGVTFYKP